MNPFHLALQILELDVRGPLQLEYDPEWLAILRSTHQLMSLDKFPPPLPANWGGRAGEERRASRGSSRGGRAGGEQGGGEGRGGGRGKGRMSRGVAEGRGGGGGEGRGG